MGQEWDKVNTDIQALVALLVVCSAQCSVIGHGGLPTGIFRAASC